MRDKVWALILGMVFVMTGCQPSAERELESLSNDGDLIVQALEQYKHQSGSYPNLVSALISKSLKHSELKDWSYKSSTDLSYTLSAKLTNTWELRYLPIASQGKLAGWYIQETGDSAARFYRSPKISAAGEIRLEKGRVGTQKAIPTH